MIGSIMRGKKHKKANKQEKRDYEEKSVNKNLL